MEWVKIYGISGFMTYLVSYLTEDLFLLFLAGIFLMLALIDYYYSSKLKIREHQIDFKITRSIFKRLDILIELLQEKPEKRKRGRPKK